MLSVRLQIYQAFNEEGCLSGYGYMDGLHVMRFRESRLVQGNVTTAMR